MKLWILAISLSLFPLFALAQSTDATISGAVTDPAGNLILNADVQMRARAGSPPARAR